MRMKKIHINYTLTGSITCHHPHPEHLTEEDFNEILQRQSDKTLIEHIERANGSFEQDAVQYTSHMVEDILDANAKPS